MPEQGGAAGEPPDAPTAQLMGGLGLFAGRVGAAGLLFAANLFLARALGPAEFGRYALSLSILTFVALFLDLGHFSSGARLLTQLDNHGERARGLIGTLLAGTALVSGAFVLVVVGLSFLVDRVFDEDIGGILRGTIFLAPAVIFPLLMEQVLKALDRSRQLALWNLGSRVIFLATVVALSINERLDALTATSAYLVGTVAATVLAIPSLHPRFAGWRAQYAELRAEHDRFGRPLYAGRLANLASYRTDVWFLAYFRDASAVGQYTLAMSFANLIAFYSQSLATTAFRQLAREQMVPRRLIRANLLGIVALGVLATIVGETIVLLFLGPAYAPVGWIIPLSVIAIALQGSYQPYNSWLLANGFGAELRSFLVVVAAINLAANALLIPLTGALGAAVASCFGMGAYLLMARRTVTRLVSART